MRTITLSFLMLFSFNQIQAQDLRPVKKNIQRLLQEIQKSSDAEYTKKISDAVVALEALGENDIAEMTREYLDPSYKVLIIRLLKQQLEQLSQNGIGFLIGLPFGLPICTGLGSVFVINTTFNIRSGSIGRFFYYGCIGYLIFGFQTFGHENADNL